MMPRKIAFAALFCLLSVLSLAQDTLPGFTVQDIGKGRIRISWINPHPNLTQLNVQRSFDSSKNFRTIFSPQSPELAENGYLDTKAPWNQMYYRIFYVVGGSSYFFTVPKKPAQGFAEPITSVKTPGVSTVTIRVRDTVYLRLSVEDFSRFRDSIIHKTKDSLFTITAGEVLLKPHIPQVVWRPSPYVFTDREGFVHLNLPLVKQRKYRLVVYEEDGTPLFEIKQVREPNLILDKGNFLHAGWFHFELYEDEVLKERNKFYLQKDF